MNDIPLIVELGERSYPIHFGVRALDELVGLVEARCTTRRAFVVTDTHVDALHGAPLRAALVGRDLDVAWCVVPAGEASKSLHEVQALYDRAFGFGVDRGTVVVAFGGGVVGDLAGFVAGTLLRGLPWVQIPTTVLSQTDSSVGGKTGVNHAAGKNLIGVFHQPALVFIDTAYLTTLPRRAIAAGLVETVKHGALVKPELVDRIRLNAPALLQPDLEALAALLRISVAVKAAIVAIDERETGPRTVLNLGHTLGHALEAEAGYGVLEHGEAVAMGLDFALGLSERLVGLPAEEAERVRGALRALGMSLDHRPWLGPGLRERLWADKKVRGGELRFVLLRRLGEPVILPVGRELIDNHLDAPALHSNA